MPVVIKARTAFKKMSTGVSYRSKKSSIIIDDKLDAKEVS